MKKLIVTLCLLISSYARADNNAQIKDDGREEFFTTMSDEMVTSYWDGLKTLGRCEFFKAAYPELYKQYETWRMKNAPVSFVAMKTPSKSLCANSNPDIQEIAINFHLLFQGECRSLVSLLGHESLHLAKLPQHVVPAPNEEQRLADIIYTIERVCFIK